MKVKLEKTFPMDAAPAAVWQLLQDIPAVAACMPGAEILEQTDATHFTGRVLVKIGPATAAFNGTLEVTPIDPSQRAIRMVGRGSDVKGASAATLDLTATVQDAEGGRSAIVGVSEVTLTGRLANFGGRLIDQVSDQLLAQFARNFAQRLGDAPKASAVVESAVPLSAFRMLWQTLWHMMKSLFGATSKGGQ
ncbi:MAG: CoxG family protein [Acidiferrobacter thiooxydans]